MAKQSELLNKVSELKDAYVNEIIRLLELNGFTSYEFDSDYCPEVYMPCKCHAQSMSSDEIFNINGCELISKQVDGKWRDVVVLTNVVYVVCGVSSVVLTPSKCVLIKPIINYPYKNDGDLNLQLDKDGYIDIMNTQFSIEALGSLYWFLHDLLPKV